MSGRRVRRQPVLANGTDRTENDHCTVTDNALSSNSRSLSIKRHHRNQLSNAKSQRSDSNDCAIYTSLQAGEKSSTLTEDFKHSTAYVSKDPGSSGDVTFTDEWQLNTPNAALGQRLSAAFFDQPCVELARNLLGKYVVRISSEDGKRLSGRIVQTESYVGLEDRASHSYGGRRTARNEAMYMPPGTSYVYNIYGIYTCMNISSRGMWN